MVSHDRDFLNSVTTDIIHLHDQRLHGYRGNFAQFEDMYEQKRKEVNKVADKFEKQMKAAKKSGSRATQDKVGSAAVFSCRAVAHAGLCQSEEQHLSGVAGSFLPANPGPCLAMLSLLRCSYRSHSLLELSRQKAAADT